MEKLCAASWGRGATVEGVDAVSCSALHRPSAASVWRRMLGDWRCPACWDDRITAHTQMHCVRSVAVCSGWAVNAHPLSP